VNKIPINMTAEPMSIALPKTYLTLLANAVPPRFNEARAKAKGVDPAALIKELVLQTGESYSEHTPLDDARQAHRDP